MAGVFLSRRRWYGRPHRVTERPLSAHSGPQPAAALVTRASAIVHYSKPSVRNDAMGHPRPISPIRTMSAILPIATRKATSPMSATCQLETSCRVPDHGLHGRKCIAVAADSAAKIKNTKPGPLAITATMTSPMPYPPDAASMGRRQR